MDLTDRGRDVGEMMRRRPAGDDVEGLVPEGERVGIPRDELDAGRAARPRVRARRRQHRLGEVVGDDADANAFILEVEKRRDPSHVRSYRAAQWNAFLRAAGLTVIEDSLIWKLREWNEWTGRMRMSAEARRDLEDFVRRAPERCRAAFEFRLAGDAVVSFNDRQILIRADRD